MRKSIAFIPGAIVLVLCVAAYGAKAKTQRRALPPKWNKTAADAFFADARQELNGLRPAAGARNVVGPATTAVVTGDAAPADSGGSFTWSKLIASDAIEDEIKASQSAFSQQVTTPAKFKGGGNKDAQLQLTVMATMFGIIAEYDGEVRWKQQAAGLRELTARAGFNCKVGTDGSYNEAKKVKGDLEELVRGGSISLPVVPPKVDWSKVAFRPALMRRLELGHQEGLAVWTANAGDFNKHADQVLHEAQVIAAIADVIQKEGYEFADDDSYLEHAKSMRKNAVDIADAVKGKNFDAARKATGEISKSCSSCHEGFRS